MFGFIRELPFKVGSGNLIEIEDACLSYTENYIEAKIKISNVVNPSSVRDTSSFIIKVMDKDKMVLAETEAGQFFVPSTEFAPADF